MALTKGSFIKVTLLIGANTDEGKLFSGYGVNTTADFRELIKNNHIHQNRMSKRQRIFFSKPGSNSTVGQIR